MIEGITILNKTAITGLPIWLTITWIAIVMISIGIVVIGGLITEWEAKIIGIAGIVAVVMFFLGLILESTVKTGDYWYECTIDDAVSYNDIVKNYEIIEQRGDIWVLEDK